ncbi:histidine phosphatase family protein [Candidatus Cetobacterium colombiensis]|uniref:Multiple inositol polyphosphate phosphatase 1 n=1 Tax=Candidatus Cetobacterium colombiensis TaxID=3073100 RepID=A0ABU4W9F7_9FUSO|nr:histidine phosphatase family protein [Candidatus Cetobacterium colombiensis]MDX8336168.1 histidine phosphatase family protein [Candidatus Cetobacterium colombiensis]
MKKLKILFLFLIICLNLFSQDNNYLGSQALYVDISNEKTQAPFGFKPFYINHLGRHGARYLSSSKSIDNILKILKKAEEKDELTPLGQELLKDILILKSTEDGEYGLLSEIGKEIEFGIGERMYKNYSEIFENNRKVFAVATYVKRTQQSMDFFLETFKKNLPEDNIFTKINGKVDPILRFFDVNTEYLKFKKNGDWKNYLKDFEKRGDDYKNIISVIFKKNDILNDNEGFKFTTDLYGIYTNQFDIGKNVNLGKYFNEKDLKYFWANKNLSMYLEKGPSILGEKLPTDISFALLEDFISTSENAIKNRNIAANLRFAHAETIIPFASLLKIDFASKQTKNLKDVENIWKDYEVSPMGANIQWIFYKNEKNEILVKMLYNEKEIEFPINSNLKPYYKWNDVKNYYENIIKNLKIKRYDTIVEEVKNFKSL